MVPIWYFSVPNVDSTEKIYCLKFLHDSPVFAIAGQLCLLKYRDLIQRSWVWIPPKCNIFYLPREVPHFLSWAYAVRGNYWFCLRAEILYFPFSIQCYVAQLCISKCTLNPNSTGESPYMKSALFLGTMAGHWHCRHFFCSVFFSHAQDTKATYLNLNLQYSNSPLPR